MQRPRHRQRHRPRTHPTSDPTSDVSYYLPSDSTTPTSRYSRRQTSLVPQERRRSRWSRCRAVRAQRDAQETRQSELGGHVVYRGNMVMHWCQPTLPGCWNLLRLRQPREFGLACASPPRGEGAGRSTQLQSKGRQRSSPCYAHAQLS